MDVGRKEKGWKDRASLVAGVLVWVLWLWDVFYDYTTCMPMYVYALCIGVMASHRWMLSIRKDEVESVRQRPPLQRAKQRPRHLKAAAVRAPTASRSWLLCVSAKAPPDYPQWLVNDCQNLSAQSSASDLWKHTHPLDISTSKHCLKVPGVKGDERSADFRMAVRRAAIYPEKQESSGEHHEAWQRTVFVDTRSSAG
jgi:hypothetical protein